MIQAGLLAATLIAVGPTAPVHAGIATPVPADQAGSGQPGTAAPPQTPETPRSGVIRPPQADIDPHMTVAPPPQSGGRMPVIPPPGTPGGKSDVEPR